MSAADIELWAACETCSRSFFVPPATLAAPESVICPVCAEPPTRVEQRSGDAVVGVHMVCADPKV